MAVVGLGGLGAAAAWEAARAGARVVGFEQFELGHVRGASHDSSRIIRRSYHTAHYVELTAAAYEAWADLEAAAGQRLVTTTGGLDLFPPGAALDAGAYRAALTAARVAHEWIDGAEIRRRWPAFAGPLVRDGVMGLVQADAGIVPAGRTTALLHDLARRAGAELRAGTPVLALEPDGAGVAVVTAGGLEGFDVAIVTADAWTARLLAPLGVDVPLEVTLEQATYLRLAAGETMTVGRCPVWIWMDDPSFYGFPVYDPAGPGGGPSRPTRPAAAAAVDPGRAPADPEVVVKLAEDCGGPAVDPDDRSFAADGAREARLCAFAEGLFGRPVTVERSVRCLYTLTADRDFLIDRVPGPAPVVVGLGAAHGFKFVPWFGRVLAALALDPGWPGPGGARPGVGRAGLPGAEVLAPFRLDRPDLHRGFDRSGWLV